MSGREETRHGCTRVSAKHQVTLPIDALERAGIRTGDFLNVEVRGPGEVLLVRHVDAVTEYAGALTGVFGAEELKGLRREWDC